jgi:hypothetical protein
MSAAAVSIGVWIGLNPEVSRIAQPGGAGAGVVPANFLFPLFTAVLLATGISLNLGYHDPDHPRSALCFGGRAEWKPKYHVLYVISSGSFNLATLDIPSFPSAAVKRPQAAAESHLERSEGDLWRWGGDEQLLTVGYRRAAKRASAPLAFLTQQALRAGTTTAIVGHGGAGVPAWLLPQTSCHPRVDRRFTSCSLHGLVCSFLGSRRISLSRQCRQV